MRILRSLRGQITRDRKRRQLDRRISVERLESRQMLDGTNQPPTIVWGDGGGTVALNGSQVHYFSSDELGFSDADGDSLDHITILSLPAQGTLLLDGYRYHLNRR